MGFGLFRDHPVGSMRKSSRITAHPCETRIFESHTGHPAKHDATQPAMAGALDASQDFSQLCQISVWPEMGPRYRSNTFKYYINLEHAAISYVTRRV